MSNSLTKFVAALMLVFMLGLAYFSMREDSAIMDEQSHLPAGYSYVTQHDMRINPEHPPLIKDLAGLSVLIWSKITHTQINFPVNIPAWTQEINSQWNFGSDFLYKEGNPADQMIFYGRLPMLLILLILGLYVFRWTKEIWGNSAALLTLFLFSFSPTFIAHGRFVTTDVAAAAGFFIASYYFIHWLRNPQTGSLILAGIFFGLAQLAKFSLFLLVPLFGFLTVFWIFIKIFGRQAPEDDISEEEKRNLYFNPPKKVPVKKEPAGEIIWRYLAGFVLILIIGYGLIVTPIYYFHVKNYPADKQLADMKYIMQSYGGGAVLDTAPLIACKSLDHLARCPAQVTIWLADKNIVFRSISQYMLGLLMVVQRAAGGNTTYFMGQVSASGWKSYFPILYLFKEPLTLHILTLLALLIIAWRASKKIKERIRSEKPLFKISWALYWLGLHFEGLAMVSLIILYWGSSLSSPLNIGIRHVLPTFAFIFALVSSQIVYWMRVTPGENRIIFALKYLLILGLMTWQIFSILKVYPSYLSYFNELAGGPSGGYRYVVDSNLDWGQDLKRLAKWVNDNGIDKIYVDYFGGGDAKYYLGDKFQPWWGTRSPNDLQSGDLLAVSATFLQGGRGTPVPGFTQDHNYYNWLDKYQPITTIGNSIFIYQMP